MFTNTGAQHEQQLLSRSAPSSHQLAVASNSFQLKQRIEQDSLRDPVDALHDAQQLHTMLASIERLLSDPALRYLLGARMREDLSRSNVGLAATEALLLLQYNERRLTAVEQLSQAL